MTVSITALERMLAEATPGPWAPESWVGDPVKPGYIVSGYAVQPVAFAEDPARFTLLPRNAHDPELIAALRNEAPALLAEIKAARRVVDRARGHLDDVCYPAGLPQALEDYDALPKIPMDDLKPEEQR